MVNRASPRAWALAWVATSVLGRASATRAEPAAPAPTTSASPAPTAKADGAAQTADQRIDALSREVDDLKAVVRQLQDQLAKAAPTRPATASEVITSAAPSPPPVAVAAPTAPPTAAPAPSGGAPGATGSAAKVTADGLRRFTINAMLDGYYEYDTNKPVGRANLLRAYDVGSNAFSLNQADLVLESATDVAAGKRWGLRLDFQYGQATSTLQGNPSNELRPDIYRNIFQAYGTYVVPVGSGVTVDFGKWASSLGYEGNYSKDQFNYSRSFWFDFLPFYHTGLRAHYSVNDKIAVNLWVTNGTQQTEPFNNFKDVLAGVVVAPTRNLTWTVNYYLGQEHPDVTYIQNPTATQMTLPNQQGTYFQPIANPPNGKLNILDSYVAWQPRPPLTLAAEADYVEERLYGYSPSREDFGGALYAAYQLTPKWAVAARLEYLLDRGALFSGVDQTLWEGTLTAQFRPADSFLLFGELRRDHSSRPYFLSSSLDHLETSQPTIGVGAVWWFGQKEGAW